MIPALFIVGVVAFSPVRRVEFSYAGAQNPPAAAHADAGANTGANTGLNNGANTNTGANTGDNAEADAPRRRMSPIARGFGESVPLAFAARQIAPTRYSITFDDGVDSNQKVSWAGGKPWPEVLHDLVKPLGLHFTAHGAAIRIFK